MAGYNILSLSRAVASLPGVSLGQITPQSHGQSTTAVLEPARQPASRTEPHCLLHKPHSGDAPEPELLLNPQATLPRPDAQPPAPRKQPLCPASPGTLSMPHSGTSPVSLFKPHPYP